MPRRQFLALLAATLVFRAWLGAAFPMTGDEAYFVGWGLRPDWGYYDHPPMVGWWLAALLPLGDAAAWLRLPAILQPVLLALALRWALPRLWPAIDAERRDWIALLVLLAPVNVWNVFVTTDTPLVYFSVLSGLAWLRAAQERPGDGLRWYLLSGVLLAGAVLSKYFVAFLGFAYLVDVLRRRSARSVAGLVAAYACTLPALALMAWWNAGNCWSNLMFNFVNRHGDAGWSWQTPPLYLLTLLYVLGPPAAWGVWKAWRRPAGADFSGPGAGTLSLLAGLPFALFALLSLAKQVGLHWLLGFVPFALAWLGLRLPLPALRRVGLLFAGFAGLHIAAVLIASRLPLETWQKTRLYDGIVLSFEHEAIGDALAPQLDGRVLAMESYSSAATLAYNLRRPVVVFGSGGVHARQDDLDTDFRTFAGRNLLILRKSAPTADDYAPYFQAVRIASFDLRGARFWTVAGDGFDYAAYRERVLQPVKERYYRLPGWLPQRACPLCDRHFPEEACRR